MNRNQPATRPERPRSVWQLLVLVGLAGLILAFLSPSTTTQASQAAPRLVLKPAGRALGQVRFIKGGLAVQPPRHKKHRGKVREALFNQYFLHTGGGQKASIGFQDGTILHLNQQTDAELRSPQVTYVKRGEVDEILIPGTNHRIQTATAVASAIGTEIDVRIAGKRSIITVVEGAALVSDKQGSVIVKTGQQTVVAPHQPPQPPAPVHAQALVSWTGTIPPSTQPLPRNVALDTNGGHVVGFSSQDAVPASRAAPAVPGASPWDVRFINDGYLDRGWESAGGQRTNQYVKLGFLGNTLATITGVVIDPAATGGHPATNDLKHFRVRVSITGTDDASFTTVFQGTALQKDSLQRFDFPTPVTARYLELVALDNYGGNAVAVAELEVAATGVPVGGPIPTSTALPTSTPTATATPTNPPRATATNTPQATATSTSTPTSTATPPPTWSGSLALSVDRSAVQAGSTVTLTATAGSSVTGTGYTIVISAQGNPPVSCTAGSVCTAQASSLTPGRVVFSAWVQDPSGNKVATAPSLTVTWYALSMSADRQTVPVGGSATLTVNALPDPGSGLTVSIVVDGQEPFPCSGGNPCSHQFSSSSAATYSFTAELTDSSGALIAQSQTLTVTWQAVSWTVTLSLAQDNSPAGTRDLTANVSQDWSGGSYVLTLRRADGNGYVLSTCSVPEFQWGCTFQVTWQLLPNEPAGAAPYDTRTYVVTLSQAGTAGSPVATSNTVSISWGSVGTVFTGPS